MNTPTEPGYYRACVYSSANKCRGVHQVVAVTDRPILTDGFPTGLERVILQVGSNDPIPEDMVWTWGERVDPMESPRPFKRVPLNLAAAQEKLREMLVKIPYTGPVAQALYAELVAHLAACCLRAQRDGIAIPFDPEPESSIPPEMESAIGPEVAKKLEDCGHGLTMKGSR